MYKCILTVLTLVLAINSYAFADELQTNASSDDAPENHMIFETVEQGLDRMREQNGQFFDAISGLNARSSVVHRLAGFSFDMLSIDDNDYVEIMPYVELPFFGKRASIVEDYSFFSSFRYLSRNEGEYELYNLLFGVKGEISDAKFHDSYSVVGWNIMLGLIYHEEGLDDQFYPEINHGWSYFFGTFRYGMEIRYDVSFRFPQTGGLSLNYLEAMFHFTIGNPKGFFVTVRPGLQAIWRGSLHEDVQSGWETFKAYVRIGFTEFIVLEPYFQYDDASEKSGIGTKIYLFYSW